GFGSRRIHFGLRRLHRMGARRGGAPPGAAIGSSPCRSGGSAPRAATWMLDDGRSKLRVEARLSLCIARRPAMMGSMSDGGPQPAGVREQFESLWEGLEGVD